MEWRGSASPTDKISTRRRRLQGKVAVVTGGAGGIGEAMARLFVEEGAKVIIADTNEKRGDKICKDVEGMDFFRCDVTKEEDVKGVVDWAVQEHGALDIMVNNAGVLGRHDGSVEDLDLDEFRRVMAVNFVGCALGIKHAARVMVPAGRGSIVCTASLASVVGGQGSHAYTASKHAVVGLVESAAAELGELGIRVNAVSPSGVPSFMSAAYHRGALGKKIDDEISPVESEFMCIGTEVMGNLKGVSLLASDVANAALFLASHEARYINGHNLLVDGGNSVIRKANVKFISFLTVVEYFVRTVKKIKRYMLAPFNI